MQKWPPTNDSFVFVLIRLTSLVNTSKMETIWAVKRGYDLGQIKWKIETTPPPKINDGKMTRYDLRAALSLIKGEGGISVPFYSVQDCC